MFNLLQIILVVEDLYFGRMMNMNINSKNQIVTSNIGTNNPLFNWYRTRHKTIIMFYTQMNEEWTKGEETTVVFVECIIFK